MDAVSSNQDQPEWLKYCGPNWYGEQDENGIDLSLIRENLKLTPLERIRKAEAALDDVLKLREYGHRHFENKVRANSEAADRAGR